MTAISEAFVPTKDGVSVYIRKASVASPKAQILLVHGYNEHGSRYQEFASFLNEHQISVTMFDLRGHGHSDGDRCAIQKWENYESDYDAAWSTMMPTDKMPTFVLGHSNGGLITLNYLLGLSSRDEKIQNINGVILTSPFLVDGSSTPRIVTSIVQVLQRWFPNAYVSTGLDLTDCTTDALKIDEMKQDEHVTDYVRFRWYSEALKTQARVQNLVHEKHIPAPLLFMLGTADTVIDLDAVHAIGESIQCRDKEILLREGEVHELLNERKRKETYETIKDWILKRR